MITETIIHTFGDGCYVRVQKGTQPGEEQIISKVLCERHRRQIEEEVARLERASQHAA